MLIAIVVKIASYSICTDIIYCIHTHTQNRWLLHLIDRGHMYGSEKQRDDDFTKCERVEEHHR